MPEQKKVSNSIKTSVGKVFEIYFSSNVAFDGRDWYLSKMDGGVALIDMRKDYVSYAALGPVREIFSFMALEPGNYKLAFNSLLLSAPGNAPRREEVEVIVSERDVVQAQEIGSEIGSERFVPLSSIMEFSSPILPYGFPNGIGGNDVGPLYGVIRPLYGVGIVPVYGIPDITPFYGVGVTPKYGVITPYYGVGVTPKYGVVRPLYGIVPVYGIPVPPDNMPPVNMPPFKVPPVGVPPVFIPPNNGEQIVIALYSVPDYSELQQNRPSGVSIL